MAEKGYGACHVLKAQSRGLKMGGGGLAEKGGGELLGRKHERTK